MLARSLWFSLSFASSIICFISSALGAVLVVAEVGAVVVVAGAVVVVVMAGLEAVAAAGAGVLVGALDGGVVSCAKAIEAAAISADSVKDAVFMERILRKRGKGSQGQRSEIGDQTS